MAMLHVKSPNGTDYNINLDTMNCQTGTGLSGGGGWTRLPNGFTVQWWSHIDPQTQMGPNGDISFGPVSYPIQFTGGGAWSLLITSWVSTPFIFMHNDRGWNSGSGVGAFRAVAPPNCSGSFCFDVLAIGSTV